jgi:tetratricopeptide (TPR) repeat protein
MSDDPCFDQKEQKVNSQTNSQTNIVNQTNNYGVSAPPPVPHQIPPKPADFTGREGEIAEILANFNQGATISGLRGMGGVGKTALALVLAERLKDRFLDGQIFLDMQGISSKPLAAEEAMVLVIRAYLGAEARLPDDLNGLSGLYNSVISGKKALILLDNAASREQVEPLLPQAGSALLITSRNKFVLPGLKEMDLDVLPLKDAKKLLLEIARRIGEHAGKLAEQCGYLPLALRNAASALAEKRNLNVADYVERLKDARKRLKLVDASFSLSYEDLTPELRRLWSLLSVFPADFDLAGAATVWERESDPAEEALGELVKWSLVDFLLSASGEGGRYRMHDLARIFAASRLDPYPSEKDKAQRRHAGHYLGVLYEADHLYQKCGEDTLAGLQLFDREEMNILAAQQWALSVSIGEQVDSKDLALKLLCSYPNVGSHIFALRLHPEKYIKFLEDALRAADQLKNDKRECLYLNKRICSHLCDRGLAFAYLGKIDEAIGSHEEQLTIARQNVDKKEEGDALYNIGRIYADKGDIRRAIRCHKIATSVYKKIDNHRGEAKSLIAQGISQRYLGDVRMAIGCHEQARKISHEKGYRRVEAYALNNLGNDYVDLEEIDKAVEYYNDALEIDRDMGDRQGEVADLGNMGYACAAKSDYENAIDNLKNAIKIANYIGDRKGEAKAEAMQGIVCEKCGHYDEAIIHHNIAMGIVQKIGYRRREGQSFVNLGNVYAANGDYDLAIDYYKKAINIFTIIKDRKGEAKAEAMQGIVFGKRGNYDKGIEHINEALSIVRDIRYRRKEGHALVHLGNLYAAKGDYKKSISLCEEAIKITKEIGDLKSEAEAEAILGMLFEKCGDYDKAIEYHERALKIFMGDPSRGGSHAFNNLGKVYAAGADDRHALLCYEHALAINRENRNLQGEGYVLYDISISQGNLGEWEWAFNSAESSLNDYTRIESHFAEKVLHRMADLLGWVGGNSYP